MKAEFFRGGDGPVATATWDGTGAVVESDDPTVRDQLRRVFRRTPVVVDDPGVRPAGSTTESVVQPGTLEWFRAAAFTRSTGTGLTVRLVPEVTGKGGWDPAAAYRTFRQSMKRLIERDARPADERDHQPGEQGPPERAETGDQPRGSDSPPTVQ